MCATCGCGDGDGTRVSTPSGREWRRHADDTPAEATTFRHSSYDDGHEHPHEHPHPHDHPHPLDHPRGHSHEHGHDDPQHHPSTGRKTVDIETDLLAKNDTLATENRAWLGQRDIVVLNLMSSPGSGKTTLLERTIRESPAGRPVAVVEGDQETLLDADRIRATGAAVVQVNTGSGCHLDADMLRRGLVALEPADGSVVFVENVGNLVCPALFDLGETARVVVISVTEGEDKPLKYPQMFAAADLVVVNKTDLLPYVAVDLDRLVAHTRSVNPGVEVLALSATSGAGMQRWHGWLAARSTTLRS